MLPGKQDNGESSSLVVRRGGLARDDRHEKKAGSNATERSLRFGRDDNVGKMAGRKEWRTVGK
jgi:hypothetical protein